MGSAVPPRPWLNGTRYRSNLNGCLSSMNSGTSFSSEQDTGRVPHCLVLVHLRPGEDDVFPVGTPGRVALNVLRVVGARQWCVGAGLGVVDNEDALDREKELGEFDSGRRHEHCPVLDGTDHVAAVGRHLGKQAEGTFAVVSLVVAPCNDLFVVQQHLLRNRKDRVAALVVAVVHIEAQRAAVTREGVAVTADRKILEDYRRLFDGVDRAEAPADARGVLDGADKRQRNLAIEDRIHRPGRLMYGCEWSRRRRLARWGPRPTIATSASRSSVRRLISAQSASEGRQRGSRDLKPEYFVRTVESQQDFPLLSIVCLRRPRRRSVRRYRAEKASRRAGT